MRNRVGLLALLFILGQASAATAGLHLTFGANGTSNIQANGTSFVDVTIASDSADPVLLAGYNFNFKIRTISSSGLLQFTHSATNEGFSGYFNDPSYVFTGNSADFQGAIAPPNPAVDPTPGVDYSSFQRISGTDFTQDMNDHNNQLFGISVTTPVLLTRLQVTDTASPINVGDTFLIESFIFDPGGGNATTETTFNDSGLNPITFAPASGTLTVVAPTAAVPEPGTLAIAATGLITLCVVRLARRERRLA